jgi:hypothetical protein
MTVDRYTRLVLTVIAGSLLYLCLLQSGWSASAQGLAPAGPNVLQPTKPQAVVIVGWGSLRSDGQVFLSTVKEQNGVVHSDPTLHMKIEQNPQQPLPVTLGVTPQHPLPVGINTIKAGAEWEPIRTKSEPAQAPKVDSK